MKNTSKNPVSHTRTQFTVFAKKGLVMLLLQLAIIFFMRGSGWGQYNFPNTPFSNSNGFTDASGGNTGLSGLQWTASNGYGIWANSQTKWFLLSNELQNESTDSPVSPSGVVSEGELGYLPTTGPHDIKVAANLHGQVRYVWPDETTASPRDHFVVKGFNNSDINITFSGIPQTANSRKVISASAISTYSIAHPVPTGALNNVASKAIGQFNEVWQDWFDVAMDAKYLYIVWVHFFIYSDQTHSYQIWATAQNLTSGAIEWGPNRVDGGIEPGEARRPTIACDVRNNPDHPTFDVAYISHIPPSGTLPNSTNDDGRVTQASVLNGGGVIISPMPRQVLKSNAIPLFSDQYFIPLHARMLVSSIAGSTRPTIPMKGIYAIVYGGTGDFNQTTGSLIFHKIINNASGPYAWYVDGSDDPHITNATHEAPLASVPGTSTVTDNPIMAFANPYDAVSNEAYDEFHCLYRLTGGTFFSDPPLVIVRGIHNGYFASLQQAILNRQCTNCNTIPAPLPNERAWDWWSGGIGGLTDPIGFVNQMGIHTYWGKGGSLIYSRDLRAFDEDIEENTLVTDTCIVADGSSHNGTLGANLLSGKIMTLWTDPNFGVDAAAQTSGIYTAEPGNVASWRNARVSLVGTGVTLDISGTRLVVLPNFQFKFGGSGQSLIIHSGSLFDYYGLPQGVSNSDPSGPVATNFLGTGTIELRGTTTTAAGLNIYPGANFALPETVMFLSGNSTSFYKYGSSITPVWSTTPNASVTGIAHFHGIAQFITSKILTQIPLGSVTDVLFFDNCLDGGTNVTTQLVSTSSIFQNDANKGFARLNITGLSNQTLTGGTLDAVGIFVPDPTKTINIVSPTFANTQTKGIDLEISSADIAYGQTNIKYCNFTTFKSGAEAGIYTDGFDINADFEKLRIEGNTFTTNTGLTSSTGVHAAIELLNSCGTVLRNTISGAGYKNGIISKGTSTSNQTNTFMCSNSISNCLTDDGSGTGITTKYWKGYSKLNELFNNDIGHLIMDNDNGGIDFCNYHNNNGPGLKLSNETSKVNASGVHHTPPNSDPDYPGWNTFAHNAQSISNTGEIVFVDRHAVLILGTNSTASDNWGHNTLIADGTINTFLIFNSDNSGTLDLALNKNFFGTGSISSPTSVPWTTGSDIAGHLHQVNSFYNPSAQDFQVSSIPYVIDFSVDCGDGFTPAHGKGNSKIQSFAEDTVNKCDQLQAKLDMLDQSGLYKTENDSGRHYIETCFFQESAFHVFVSIDGAVQFMSNDNNRWLEYRTWLKKVLYLSLDSLYYCSDVYSILHTFQYLRPGLGKDYNGGIAVTDYLLKNNRCPDGKANLLEGRNYDRDKQVKIWRDTVKDSLKTPLDTSAVTLESLDLGILRGQQNAVTPSSKIHTPTLGNLVATKNPFTDETVLETVLDEAEMLKLEIFDLLGKSLYNENRFFSEGDMKWSLSGKTLPHGTFYARISTVNGSVRTIKLIHE